MAWYDNIAGLSQMALPVTIERGKPAPLDKYSLFDNYDSALTFAREHASAFIGAFVYVLADGAVGDDGNPSGTLGAYIITGIGENAELHKLAETTASGDLAGDVAALQTKVNTLLADENTTGSVDQKVKAAIDAYKAINDPLVEGLRTDVDANKAAVDASIADLTAKIEANEDAIADNKAAADASLAALVSKDSELEQAIADNKTAIDASLADIESKVENVAVYDLQPVEDPAEEWAAQYIFSKDGETVTTINIPKDQFLKEASYVGSASAEDVAADASVVEGDPYLKFVWQLPDSQATTYVPVKELVDSYSGSEYINVNDVEGGKQIILNYDALLAQIKIDIIDTINGQLSDLTDKDAELEQAIADNKAAADASLGELSQAIADNKAVADASLGELVAKVEAVEGTQGTADASISAIESKNAEFEQAIADNKAAADASLDALVDKDSEIEQAVADNKAAADASISAIEGSIAKIESATVNGVSFNKDEEGNLSVNVEAGSIKIGADIDESITAGSSVADAFTQVIAKIDTKEVGVVSVSASSADNALFVNNDDPANPVVGLNVSAEEGNILSVKADGVYAAMEWQAI